MATSTVHPRPTRANHAKFFAIPSQEARLTTPNQLLSFKHTKYKLDNEFNN